MADLSIDVKNLDVFKETVELMRDMFNDLPEDKQEEYRERALKIIEGGQVR